MKPVVSILVPVYNASQWLRQCLDSIVGQSYESLQVVLVDDGSTDESLAICREYAERYPFVEAYHQENRGVAVARNSLLDKVRGDYVLFVDADDWIEQSAIEVMLRVAEADEVDIVVCDNYTIINNRHSVYRNCAGGKLKVLSQQQTIKEFLRHDNLRGMLWNKLIKQELLSGKKFDSNVGYGEDAQILWSILQEVDNIGVLSQPLYNYRISSNSISGQLFSSKKMTALNVWRQICDDVDVKYPQYKTIAYGRYGAEATLLLYNAIKSCSAADEKVVLLRKTIVELLPYMRRCDFVSPKMLWFARVATRCYSLAKLFVR